jgi:outer membrane biosynthesis protein TonB
LTPALIETGKVQHLGHPDPFAEWDGRAPEVLNLVEVSNQIPYPEEAKLQKVSGIVQLKILVDATGTYVRHIVVNPEKTHPLLVVAIEPYLTQLKFKPGLNSNAKPDLAWVQVPFRFTLTSY